MEGEVISGVRWSVPPVREGVRQMELYINNSWTERYGNAHIAQARDDDAFAAHARKL